MNPVMIDPGHGGRDPGATAFGLSEKDLNLAIALELARALEELKIPARLTRGRDLFRSLGQRCELANNSFASAFISVHCNASANPGARGCELFYMPGCKDGLLLAEQLRRGLSGLGRRDRGVSAADFYVLRHAAMPACLVECGFLTNPGESAWLKGHAREIAQALAAGAAGYLGEDQA